MNFKISWVGRIRLKFRFTRNLGLIALLSTACLMQANAQTLRMHNAFPSDATILGEGGKRFADQVNRRTAGRVNIELLEPGDRVDPFSALTATSLGNVEAAFTTTSFFTEGAPEMNYFAAVPFGATGLTQYQWLRSGTGRKLFDQIHRSQYRLKALPCLLLGAEAGGWFKRPIRRASDFNGLNMRFFGPGALVIERLGANPLPLRSSDIIDAFESGAIDATEYSVPALDVGFRFDRFAKHYYYPGWHQHNSLMVVYFNEDAWSSISAVDQAIIEEACHDNVLYWHRIGIRLNRTAFRTLQGRGIRAKRIPQPVL